MNIKATHRNARMAPRKIRQFRGAIRGLSAQDAAAQLRFMAGQAPAILHEVLQSAIANAEHNYDIPVENLRVTDIIIDGGFALKRFRPVSKGMAHAILKRTSHVTIVVTDTKSEGKIKKSKRKTQIEEFTAADVAAGTVGSAVHEDTIVPQDETKPEGAVKHKSKQEEARGKMSVMPKGDSTKGHRRKSIG